MIRSSLSSSLTPITIKTRSLATIKSAIKNKIKRRDDSRPISPFLIDSFGRSHNYLRISLTEKCNLRCTYCMPEQGVPLLPKDNILSAEEIDRLANMFVKAGVEKIRLTGGEPTVRSDLLDIVKRLGSLGLSSLGMTSNGIALKRKLPDLVKAGLTHLNISLDTLDTFKYELITRRRGYDAVMEVLALAQTLPGLNVKINCVVIKGLNDDEAVAFAALTKDQNITVRFIEYMPFEAKLVPSAHLVERIRAVYPTLSKLADPHSDTTRSWKVDQTWKGKIGFISSMSDHFCGECSRLRVGAEGGVKVCLFGPPVLALRPLLRSNLSDEEILPHIGKIVQGKKWSHDGLGGAEGIKLNGKSGPMVSIGGRRFNYRRASVFSPTSIPTHLLSSAFTSSLHQRQYTSSASAHNNNNSHSKPELTHIDPKTGKPTMVSVSQKPSTHRTAQAIGSIYLPPHAFSLISSSSSPSSSSSSSKLETKKGDVLSIAQLAGIMASKTTSSLIPLCHPLALTHISITLTPIISNQSILISATVECFGPTGVEMEALMGVNVALLTVWDMLKAVAGKEMRIGEIMVVKKSGGRSGDWERS